MPISKTQYISKFLIIRILIDVRIYDIRENLGLFFGKPICNLTYHQIDLLRSCIKYKNILSEISEVPEEYQNAEGYEDWFYLKRNRALPTQEEIAKQKEMWGYDSV